MKQNIIYLDNAATTKVDETVLKTIESALKEEYGNPSSLHSLGLSAHKKINEAQNTFQKLFGDDKKIIFTSCGTESNNQIIFGLKHLGKSIVTTKIEHPSIIEPLQILEKHKYKITYLDVDKQGFVNEEQLKDAVTEDTFLVSIMHANNEIGTLQDIEKLQTIAKEQNPNVIFHTDASQSFLKEKMPNVDAITISAHKIHGPKGIGALIIKKDIKIKPIFYGGHQQNNLRSGTQNVPGIFGFEAAIKENPNVNYIKELQRYLISELNEIKGVTLNTPKMQKDRICTIINIRLDKVEGEVMLHHLEQDNIFVSTGSACSASKNKPSHVLKAIGLSDEQARCSLRISLSRFNTKNDIDLFMQKLKEYYDELKPKKK